MAAFQSIPVVDLQGTEDNLAARKRAAEELRHACSQVGFFYLKNSGMPADLIERAFDQSRQYFALALQDKQKIPAHSNNMRGYSGLLAENVDPDNHGDLHESFDMGPEGEAADGSMQRNVWPDSSLLPSFQAISEAYYRQAIAVFRRLLPLFAMALGLDEHFFDDKSDRDSSILRFLYYPPRSVPTSADEAASAGDKVLGIGAHTDYEMVTLLAQQSSGVTALQVKNTAGQWIDVPPQADCDFICNIGDQLAMWTNDVFISTMHRALNHPASERLSIPCFCGVNYDTVIETLPTCVSDERPLKYQPVQAGAWVAQRLEETYAASKPSS